MQRYKQTNKQKTVQEAPLQSIQPLQKLWMILAIACTEAMTFYHKSVAEKVMGHKRGQRYVLGQSGIEQ